MTRFKVKIRRDFSRAIKPEAEQVDGKIFWFVYGWSIDDEDPYPGEVAWCPRDETYPKDAPLWLASGDLEEPICTCPIGNGSLLGPCPSHPYIKVNP